MTEIKRRWALYVYNRHPFVDPTPRLEALRSWAASLGAEIVAEICDAGTDYGGLDAILTMLAKERVEAVAVHDLNQLGRDAQDLERVLRFSEQIGTGSILTLREGLDLGDPAVRTLLRIMSAISNAERRYGKFPSSTGTAHEKLLEAAVQHLQEHTEE